MNTPHAVRCRAVAAFCLLAICAARTFADVPPAREIVAGRQGRVLPMERRRPARSVDSPVIAEAPRWGPAPTRKGVSN